MLEYEYCMARCIETEILCERIFKIATVEQRWAHQNVSEINLSKL